jgi:hypothetical protein
MLIEKIMNRFDRTALQWRGMGPLKYLPFLVCYVLVPVTIYILQSAGTTYHLLDTMWNQIALIYPIMAAWWTALCVEPVMGQEGELFGLYERNKWVDVLIYFVLYDIMIVPVCLWIMNRWPDYIYPEDFIGLFIQCFFSACLVYGIACLVRSVAVSFLAMLIFNLFLNGRISYILVDNLDLQTGIYSDRRH